jgi:RNA polymerase sigma factor (sigma-70 family)
LSKTIYDKETDESLVEYYRNSHDLVYIGELYLRYTKLVFGVSMKYLQNEDDAHDATMSIFEKLITELKKHHVTAFRPWLYMVAKNYCMMEFRKSAKQRKNQVELKIVTQDSVEMASDLHLENRDDKEIVLKQLELGMQQLKEDQKMCLQLFYIENKSYKEIVEKTNYTINEVKSHIQNGKRNLKNYMTENNG